MKYDIKIVDDDYFADELYDDPPTGACQADWDGDGFERKNLSDHLYKTYVKLNEGKVGCHWAWVALERIANGEPEEEVMRDYGYSPCK